MRQSRIDHCVRGNEAYNYIVTNNVRVSRYLTSSFMVFLKTAYSLVFRSKQGSHTFLDEMHLEKNTRSCVRNSSKED
jgi:hypothetical protein